MYDAKILLKKRKRREPMEATKNLMKILKEKESNNEIKYKSKLEERGIGVSPLTYKYTYICI
jgi:hypothetical protein